MTTATVSPHKATWLTTALDVTNSTLPWTDNHNGSSDASSGYYAQSQYVSRQLMLTLSPLLLCTGVVFNALSFVVLQRSSYRHSSTGFLLSTLGVLDTLSLLTGLLRRWVLALTDNAVDVRLTGSVGCAIHYFLTYASQGLGSWTVVVFTVERAVSVTVPLRAKQLCSRGRMVCVWAVAATVVSGFYAQLLGIVSIGDFDGRAECYFRQVYLEYGEGVFVWLDLAVLGFLPALIIISCNVVIIVTMVKSSRQARNMAAGSDVSNRSVTAMLLVVSFVFTITNMPYAIYFATMPFFPLETDYELGADWLAYNCLSLLYYVNNTINFILYCASAERFRLAFTEAICGLRPGKKDVSSYSDGCSGNGRSVNSTRRMDTA